MYIMTRQCYLNIHTILHFLSSLFTLHSSSTRMSVECLSTAPEEGKRRLEGLVSGFLGGFLFLLGKLSGLHGQLLLLHAEGVGGVIELLLVRGDDLRRSGRPLPAAVDAAAPAGDSSRASRSWRANLEWKEKTLI